MINNMYIKLLVILFVFLLGLNYVIKYNHTNIFENFDNNSYKCPNVLYKKDSNYFLFNSKLAKVPGVNPIQFKTLEEYAEFLEWSKSQNMSCPVLYLEYSYDTQGNEVYNTRTSPFDQENILLPDKFKGLHPGNVSDIVDANLDNPKYNQSGQVGYDEQDQYVGLETPMDKMFNNNDVVSANPMDSNWGGINYTKQAIASGKFKGDNI